MSPSLLSSRSRSWNARNGFVVSIQAGEATCPDAVTSAVAYFDEYKFVPWIQELLLDLAESRPQNPFALVEVRASRARKAVAGKPQQQSACSAPSVVEARLEFRTTQVVSTSTAVQQPSREDLLKQKLRSVLCTQACAAGFVSNSAVAEALKPRLRGVLVSKLASGEKLADAGSAPEGCETRTDMAEPSASKALAEALRVPDADGSSVGRLNRGCGNDTVTDCGNKAIQPCQQGDAPSSDTTSFNSKAVVAPNSQQVSRASDVIDAGQGIAVASGCRPQAPVASRHGPFGGQAATLASAQNLPDVGTNSQCRETGLESSSAPVPDDLASCGGDSAESSQKQDPPALEDMMAQAKEMMKMLFKGGSSESVSRAMSPASCGAATSSQQPTPLAKVVKGTRGQTVTKTTATPESPVHAPLAVGRLVQTPLRSVPPPAVPSWAERRKMWSPTNGSIRPTTPAASSPRPGRSESLPSFSGSPVGSSQGSPAAAVPPSFRAKRPASSSQLVRPLRLPAVNPDASATLETGKSGSTSASSTCAGGTRAESARAAVAKVPKLRLDNLQEKIHEAKMNRRLSKLKAQAQRMGIKPDVVGDDSKPVSVEDAQAGLQAQLQMLTALGNGPRTSLEAPPALEPALPESPGPQPPSPLTPFTPEPPKQPGVPLVAAAGA